MEDNQVEIPDVITHYDPVLQMINFNMQYLVNNNIYQQKINILNEYI